MHSALASDETGWTGAFHLSDRMGSYGLIGLILCIAGDSAQQWAIETWLMSCRALGRQMERFMFDRLMDAAGIVVLLATSKHNVQYLLGGHRAFFFDYMDAMGLSRYLPVLVYPKEKPEKAAYFGHRLEGFQQQVKPLWVSEVQTNYSGALDTMKISSAGNETSISFQLQQADISTLLRVLKPKTQNPGPGTQNPE